MSLSRPCMKTDYKKVAGYAVKALFLELKSYPKPGLVSFVDSGAHTDMDANTFYKSLFALRNYFSQVVRYGNKGCDFFALKKLAIQAENTMLRVTNGINTHKGAIFALGLMSATLASFDEIIGLSDLKENFILQWQKPLQMHDTLISKSRQQQREKYNIKGAKDLAIDGYSIVFDYFDEFIYDYKHNSLDMAVINAYVYLMQNMDDTNILNRCGYDTLIYAKNRSKDLLNCQSTELLNKAVSVHREFSSANISPGGVADMIALLLLLGQYYHKDLVWR
ncbi:hypothetical protein F7310_08020 [Francisella uliginis]|uniref:triphosphoribosyl-dephospho-CoA synthase n=2 Tax=Francisella uliginis TaxID=573570 RepID=A0A1L4BTZ1_9GAMM|nr:hypothetical protein F7310_08020 [Francisella uliginis]